jgi:HlyD family secretion protein
MKRKWFYWIVLAAVAFGALGGLTYYTANGQTTEQSETTDRTTARLGDLTISVSGAGELQPAWEFEMGFESSGVLTEMLVGEGDAVQVGDVLARLRVDKTEAELAAEIASAELAAIAAQQTLDLLNANAQLESAQALVALEEAQQALEEAKDNTLEAATAQQTLATAQEAVEAAEMNLYILNSMPSEEAKYIVYSGLLFRKQDLEEIQAEIAETKIQIQRATTSKMKRMFKIQLYNLQIKEAEQVLVVANAQARYNSMGDLPDALDISVAQAQLKTAQSQVEEAQRELEDALAGPDAGDVAMAEANLAEAQSAWKKLENGPDPDELAVAKTELAEAQAMLALVLQEELVVDLVAPVDGSLLEIHTQAGDRVGEEAILTLADLSQPVVEVYLDETDLDSVRVGNKAKIVFDAIPDSTYTGLVVAVDPILSEVGGVDAVMARVSLDEMPASLSNTPLMGLNATVDIIAAQVRDAVLVPIEALHETASGEYTVYVLQGDALEARPVTVGIQDYTTAEIMDGLEAGEVIALIQPEGTN